MIGGVCVCVCVCICMYTGSLRHKCVRNWTEHLGPNITDQEWTDWVNDESMLVHMRICVFVGVYI